MEGNNINLEIQKSFDHCEKIAKNHYENFPVGSVLIPKDKRKYVWSIYAFARYADDIADSAELTPEEKIERLEELERDLAMASKNELELMNSNSIFLLSLAQTMKDLSIPVSEFNDLLMAFRQDAVKQRYDTFDEILDYSSYSANPIGHLVLYVFGYSPVRDGKLFEYSDSICTALQLTNFWQDVSVDLEIGRVYIPEEIMKKHGYSYENLLDKLEDDSFISIMDELVEKTRRIFLHGKPLIDSLNGKLKYEINATYLGGNEILNMIEKINYRVLSERPKLSKANKISLLFKTIFGRT